MNIENIKKTQEALARLMFSPHYDMGEWIGSNECGTTLCLGGLACSLALSLEDLKPSVDNLQRKTFRSSIRILCTGSSSRLISYEGNVKREALRFFGLVRSCYRLVDDIFYSTRWPCGLVALYDFTTPRAIEDLDKKQSNNLLYDFVLSNPALPCSFWRTLAGYLALQSLIDYGVDWKSNTYYYSPSDFMSFNREAVARFIEIAQELLSSK